MSHKVRRKSLGQISYEAGGDSPLGAWGEKTALMAMLRRFHRESAAAVRREVVRRMQARRE